MRSMTGEDGYSLVAQGRSIPRPQIPVAPVPKLAPLLRLGPLWGGRGDMVASPFDFPHKRAVKDGRSAIYQALRLAGIGPGDEVLVPDYHCIAMIVPILALGARPVFYAIDAELMAQPDAIRPQISKASKALLVVNYFGFPNRLAACAELCRAHGLMMIEDCAHSLYGRSDGQSLGSFGDYSICSMRKFLPVQDGGLLASAHHPIDLPPAPKTSWGGALRSFASYAASPANRGAYAVFGLAWAGVKRLIPNVRAAPDEDFAHSDQPPMSASSGSASSDLPYAFDIRLADDGADFGAGFWLRQVDRCALYRRRRAHYQAIIAEISTYDSKIIRPLKPHLDEDMVPHMVPLLVDDLSQRFRAMEDAALPMQRFGQFLWSGEGQKPGLAADRLSRHLIQIPCHQDLTTRQLGDLLGLLRRLFGGRS